MRIGMVTAEFPPAVGGVGDHAVRLASGLAALGHTVDVVTSRPAARSTTVKVEDEATGSLESHEADAGVPGACVHRVIARWDWRILPALERLARQRGWDVLHVQYQPAAYDLHPAINVLPRWINWRRGRCPQVVTTCHDLRLPYLFPKAGRLRRMVVRDMVRASDAVIAVADTDVPQLRAWTASARPPVLIEHIPLGNHFDAPPPPGFDRDSWRQRLDIPADAFVVAHLGFVNRSKALGELLAAIAWLIERGGDVRLLMIGNPLGDADGANNAQYLAQVEATIARLGLGQRVSWTGHQDAAAIGAWLRCADVAALPFVDGASLRRTSLIASWCHGVPVVTTRPPMATRWTERRPPVAHFLAEATPGSLATAIQELIGSPARREALSAAGRAFGAQFFWPEVVARTLSLYRAALARGSR